MKVLSVSFLKISLNFKQPIKINEAAIRGCQEKRAEAGGRGGGGDEIEPRGNETENL